MNTQQFEQLRKSVDTGMRAIQGADDELDQGEGRADLAVARHLIERCQEHCSQALRLLPPETEAGH